MITVDIYGVIAQLCEDIMGYHYDLAKVVFDGYGGGPPI